MDHNVERVKLNQALAKATAELKKFEIEKFDFQKRLRYAEQELPTLESTLKTARADAERKKQALDHHAVNLHAATQEKFAKVKPVEHHEGGFSMMVQKNQIDRELMQKEQEIERKITEIKRHVAEMQHKQYDMDRLADEVAANKRDIERKILQIDTAAALAKRAAASVKTQAAQPQHFKSQVDISEEKTHPED
jgi:hypothetical protein